MSQNRCYMGNIPFSADEAAIRAFFTGLDVRDVKIITDKDTGRPRGFAFVEFASADALSQALALDQTEMGGRRVVVNVAKPQTPRGGKGRERGNGRDSYDEAWREGKRR